jgi:hypothetical protein
LRASNNSTILLRRDRVLPFSWPTELLAGTTAGVFAFIVIGAADDILALNQLNRAWHSLHQPNLTAGIRQKENKATGNRCPSEKGNRLLTVAAVQKSGDQWIRWDADSGLNLGKVRLRSD